MNKLIIAREILAVARILSSPVIIAAPNVDESGEYQVNMSVVKYHDDEPPHIQSVIKEIQNGNGTVSVRQVRGDMAEIYGTGTHSFLLGEVWVPIEALTRI